jgi:hypothetical protein
VNESEFVPLNLSTDEIIAQGMRTLKCWSRVFAGIQSLESVFVRPPAVETWHLKVELQDDEQTVLSRVNGRLSVEQISELSFGSSFETCRTLWMLSVLGLIQRADSADLERSQTQADEASDRVEVGQIVDRFNRLFERVYTFIDSKPAKDAEAFARSALAEIAPQFGVLFSGVDLIGSGRIDPDIIYTNLQSEALDKRRALVSTGLSELVYAMQFLVHQNYGTEDAAVISGFIREGL